MNTREKQSRRTYWNIVLSCIAAAVAIGWGLTLLSQSLADSPAPKLPGEVASPAAQHRVIGLPNVSTFAVQHFNTLGLNDTTETVVEFASPGGTVTEILTDTLPSESIYLYTGPDDPTDLARIEYDESPSGGNLIFGANFELSDFGNAAYLGLDATLEEQGPPSEYGIYIMLLMKDPWGWTTGFTIQNRYGQDPATVVVSFYDQYGNPACVYTVPTPIPPNGSVSFDLANITCLEDGFMGSAYVSSDQEVAVSSVSTYNDELGLRSAYQGISEASTVLVVPALFKANNLQTSVVCVQNGGTATTDVSVEYSDGVMVNETIPPFAVYCLNQGAEAHAAGWAGGAVIRSTGEPLVAVVNVTAYDDTTPVGRWSYTASVTDTIDQGLAFPLLFNESDDWTSEIHLYNPGDSPAVITPRHVSYPTHVVYCAEPLTIPAGGVLSISQAELPRLLGQNMAYFNTTQPVAAVVGVTSDKPLGETDRHFGYRAAYPEGAISFPDTCDTIYKVFLPAVFKEAQ